MPAKKMTNQNPQKPQLSGGPLQEAAGWYNAQLDWIVWKVRYARLSNPNANAGVPGTTGGSQSLFKMPACFKGKGVLKGTETYSKSAKSHVKLKIKPHRNDPPILVHVQWVDKAPSEADAFQASGNIYREAIPQPKASASAAAAAAASTQSAAGSGAGAQASYEGKAAADAKTQAAGHGAMVQTVKVSLLTPPAPRHPSIAAQVHAAHAAPAPATTAAASAPPYPSVAARLHAAQAAPAPATTAAASASPYPSVAAQVHAAHAAAAPQPPPPVVTAHVSLLLPKNHWG